MAYIFRNKSRLQLYLFCMEYKTVFFNSKKKYVRYRGKRNEKVFLINK